ncbi:hypothetical protein F5Y19DRAFT_347165 [Xylariaceae sp. FL1651]|nr:hypothetical protein F5Y19DRAFT_347165 [Xylariaceae sp. FL1651]
MISRFLESISLLSLCSRLALDLTRFSICISGRRSVLAATMTRVTGVDRNRNIRLGKTTKVRTKKTHFKLPFSLFFFFLQ